MNPSKSLIRTYLLRVRNLGPVPSFKTGKRATFNRQSGKPFVYSLPQHARWMKQAEASLLSQLLAIFPIESAGTLTAQQARSWIASCVPQDDCWTSIPRLHVHAELGSEEQVGFDVGITLIEEPQP